MTTPFRQLILPGDSGSDVLAYKRAFRAMNVKGSGGLTVNGASRKKVGPQFVQVAKTVQGQHQLAADGKCGPATHAVVAPHFDAYGSLLYRSATIRPRKPPSPPIGHESAQQAAAKLLGFFSEGKYRADNPGDLRDIQATAAGKAVWSQGGYWVHLDHRPLELLIWLITQGHKIGTFALCSDHHNDGPRGHAGGLCVDISSIDGVSVAGGGAHAKTFAMAELIRTAPAPLRPSQLICGGSGYVFSSEIENLCIPSPGFYGYETLSEHRNHIHAGYF